jgi:phage gp29-like protein
MTKFLAASEAISQGAPGVLPNGSVYTANDGPRGSQPFQPRLEWLARGLVLAGTGGLLTMLSQSGSGTLAGSAHMEAFKSLARADAAAISAVLQKQLDLRILRKAGLLRPGARALAWFELASKEEHDVGAAITNVSTLATHYDLDPGQVEEATGFKVRPKPATPAVGPNSGSAFPFTARASAVGPRSDVATSPDEPLPQEIEALAAALRGDLAPLGAELARALEATDGDWPSALTRLRDRLPEIAATIDPATIAAVEAPLARAIASVLPPDPEEAT